MLLLSGVMVTVPCVGLGAMGTNVLVGVVTPLPVLRVGVALPDVKSALLAVEPGEHRRSCNEDNGESPACKGKRST